MGSFKVDGITIKVNKEKLTRVNFSYWGNLHSLDIPKYAMKHEYETKIQAVCRAITRRIKLHVVTCRGDGTVLDGKGEPESNHYQLTLGRSLRSGGYNIHSQIWVAILI